MGPEWNSCIVPATPDGPRHATPVGLADTEYLAKRKALGRFLEKIEEFVPWVLLLTMLAPYYYTEPLSPSIPFSIALSRRRK